MPANKSNFEKVQNFKSQKTFNTAKDHTDEFYKENPAGGEIEGLYRQTLQPINLNERAMAFNARGKLQMVRDVEEAHDFSKLIEIYPKVFEPHSFSNNHFANIYFNRITDNPKKSDKVYVRILDVIMKSEGFYLQNDYKYNKKPTYKLLLNVLKAGKLFTNLSELEIFAEKTISSSLAFGEKDVEVACNRYMKECNSNNPDEKMMFLDFYVNWSKNDEIPVVVGGEEKMMSPEDFNQQCLGFSYDMVLSVNPWIRYTGSGGVSVGFNYNVEHIDVTDNK